MEIIRSVNETGYGYRMEARTLNILCYADDAILLAETEDDLQQLYKFKTVTEKFNMTISTKKLKQW